MDSFITILRVVGALAVVVVALLLVQKKMRKTGVSAGHLSVIARRGLGQKSSVVLLDNDGQRFMLGVTEHGITVLHQGAAPELAQAVQAMSDRTSFAGALTAAVKQHNDPNGLNTTTQYLGAGPLAGSLFDLGAWRQLFRAGKGGLK